MCPGFFCGKKAGDEAGLGLWDLTENYIMVISINRYYGVIYKEEPVKGERTKEGRKIYG